MRHRYIGGFISQTIPATSRGIFTLTQQMRYKKLGLWG